MVEPLNIRHRQTKGAETDMLSLTLPRHTSTLPIRAIQRSRPMSAQGQAEERAGLSPARNDDSRA
jgi:hypothetical protein